MTFSAAATTNVGRYDKAHPIGFAVWRGTGMSLRLLELLIRNGVKLFGRHRENWSLSHLTEHLAPTIVADAGRGRQLRFYGHGTYVPWRATRLLTKEPETIAWIDSFEDGDVLWDVGANIGVYTLYAGLNPQVRIVACEPVANTYFALDRSIALNGMEDRITALCIGVGEDTRISRMFLRLPEAGSSGHALDDSVNTEGAFDPVGTQSTITYSIDDLVSNFDLPFPTHIKVDVDGTEKKVVLGAARTLRDARLKSVLIEMPGITPGLRALFDDAGLKIHEEGPVNTIFTRV